MALSLVVGLAPPTHLQRAPSPAGGAKEQPLHASFCQNLSWKSTWTVSQDQHQHSQSMRNYLYYPFFVIYLNVQSVGKFWSQIKHWLCIKQDYRSLKWERRQLWQFMCTGNITTIDLKNKTRICSPGSRWIKVWATDFCSTTVYKSYFKRKGKFRREKGNLTAFCKPEPSKKKKKNNNLSVLQGTGQISLHLKLHSMFFFFTG